MICELLRNFPEDCFFDLQKITGAERDSEKVIHAWIHLNKKLLLSSNYEFTWPISGFSLIYNNTYIFGWI